jgi:hypothetical protein
LATGIDTTAIPHSQDLQARAAPHDQAPLTDTHPLTVYDGGRRAIGFIRPLGTNRFEALDLDRKSLGIFPTRGAAADAIEEAVS